MLSSEVRHLLLTFPSVLMQLTKYLKSGCFSLPRLSMLFNFSLDANLRTFSYILYFGYTFTVFTLIKFTNSSTVRCAYDKQEFTLVF